MKIAKTQPYLFPYLGYFQLINAVDFFGIADDVQYIKQGWITSNCILQKDKAITFSFSVKKDSYEKNINERFFTDNFAYEKKKFVKTLIQSYSKAPFFNQTMELIELILSFNEKNISTFLENHLRLLCNYMDINTVFMNNSLWKIEEHVKLDSQEKLLKKLSNLGANQYINSIGGIKLYNKDRFERENIQLSFLKTNPIEYKQLGTDFVPNLSIIDVLMFNDKEEIKKLLNLYELI